MSAVRKVHGTRFGTARPILLVHGFASTAAMLAPLARHLARRLRRPVVRVALSPGRDDLRISAAQLDRVLDELAAASDFEFADVVAHSMGGLTATWVLKRLDRGRRVRAVVTLGTPHRGTPLARLGLVVCGALSRAIWQMLPGSCFVRELCERETPHGSFLISIRGDRDWIVPERCSRLAPSERHRNKLLRGIRHTELLVAREALAHVALELAQLPIRPPACAAAGAAPLPPVGMAA